MSGMGSLYRSKHEMIYVFKAGRAPHRNNVELGRHGRNRTNLWEYPGQNTFYRGRDQDLTDRSTVKPVAFVADAIHLAVTTGRREVKVTGQTVAFAIANTVAPGLVDWAAGKFGPAMQASHKEEVRDARDENLFEPSSRPSGTHGPFDSESLRFSPQMALNKVPMMGMMISVIHSLEMDGWEAMSP